ncbi:hypothetical protein [Dictyobacter vulcani]|uniref:hypothetical protein n=1 Tax=Dictyobacter vulcani TaxID=2607529 RepID=UPI0012507048|nr:hypothetical protein [Dictyobacter vulcani]
MAGLGWQERSGRRGRTDFYLVVTSNIHAWNYNGGYAVRVAVMMGPVWRWRWNRCGGGGWMCGKCDGSGWGVVRVVSSGGGGHKWWWMLGRCGGGKHSIHDFVEGRTWTWLVEKRKPERCIFTPSGFYASPLRTLVLTKTSKTNIFYFLLNYFSRISSSDQAACHNSDIQS